MKAKILILFLIVFSSATVFGQSKKLKINHHSFIIKVKKINNEWKTKDEVKELYIKQNGKEKLVLTYFAFKDEGGDCNNLFWDKEWMSVKDNTITITSHHFQKRLDPITEWEKKTYNVNKNGEIELTAHLFKKYGSTKWKAVEE